MDEQDLSKDFKNNPFTVPDNYFRDFDKKVLDRIGRQKAPMRVFGNAKRWGIAASIFIVAAVSVFLYANMKTEKFNLAEAEVNEAELVSFFSEEDLSVDELSDLISNEFIDSIYHAEIILVNNKSNAENEPSADIEEEYSPLDEEETEI